MTRPRSIVTFPKTDEPRPPDVAIEEALRLHFMGSGRPTKSELASLLRALYQHTKRVDERLEDEAQEAAFSRSW